jgi:hypothetical protein
LPGTSLSSFFFTARYVFVSGLVAFLCSKKKKTEHFALLRRTIASIDTCGRTMDQRALNRRAEPVLGIAAGPKNKHLQRCAAKDTLPDVSGTCSHSHSARVSPSHHATGCNVLFWLFRSVCTAAVSCHSDMETARPGASDGAPSLRKSPSHWQSRISGSHVRGSRASIPRITFAMISRKGLPGPVPCPRRETKHGCYNEHVHMCSTLLPAL